MNFACKYGLSARAQWNDAVLVTPALAPAGKEYEGYQPMWFHQRTDLLTGEKSFVYKGGYWEAKEKQNWKMCPDIF